MSDDFYDVFDLMSASDMAKRLKKIQDHIHSSGAPAPIQKEIDDLMKEQVDEYMGILHEICEMIELGQRSYLRTLSRSKVSTGRPAG